MGLRSARRVACWMFAAALTSGVWGCGGGGGTTTTTTPTDNTGGTTPTPTGLPRTVTGFVGDWTSGQGIPGAQVQLGTVLATTGATGLFTASDVARIEVQVTVTAAGYQPATPFTLGTGISQISVRLYPIGTPVTVEPPPDVPGI